MTDVRPQEGLPEARGRNGYHGESHIVPLRLQKFLARAGVASRRGSEKLMSSGRVTVNGIVVTELGSRVDPLADEVAVDGVPVRHDGAAVTLMLNKPAGYVTTMSDPQGRPCVAELVPTRRYPGLYPIGRLDNDTTGILLFSTDGDLGYRLLHPKYGIEKVYEVCVRGRLDEAACRKLEQGIHLSDGMTAPTQLRITAHGTFRAKETTEAEITLREGRKRQVRRMFDAVGHPVITLNRRVFASVTLGELERGRWRLLGDDELTKLYSLASYSLASNGVE